MIDAYSRAGDKFTMRKSLHTIRELGCFKDHVGFPI